VPPRPVRIARVGLARRSAASIPPSKAGMIGDAGAAVARLESGRVKPSTRTLERLAAATGMRLRISFEPAPVK
jgi:transcriptional regulator with XRE-family HTH domain